MQYMYIKEHKYTQKYREILQPDKNMHTFILQIKTAVYLFYKLTQGRLTATSLLQLEELASVCLY